MRAGKPIVFGSREMPASVEGHASDTHAHLFAAGRDFGWEREGSCWSWRGIDAELRGLQAPSLPGRHQLDNAAAVLALCELAGFNDVLEPETVNAALGQISLAGRMQRIESDPRWLLDVAHNPAAAEALAAMLRDDEVDGRTLAVVGLLDDKDVAGVVAPLSGIVDEWIAVTAESSRAIPADELARQIANFSGSACLVADSIQIGLDRAASIATTADRILVTGSFYVVGPALAGLYSPRIS